jgi:hypothetical protein
VLPRGSVCNGRKIGGPINDEADSSLLSSKSKEIKLLHVNIVNQTTTNTREWSGWTG